MIGVNRHNKVSMKGTIRMNSVLGTVLSGNNVKFQKR